MQRKQRGSERGDLIFYFTQRSDFVHCRKTTLCPSLLRARRVKLLDMSLDQSHASF
jgi:hypothetical protein